MTDLVEFLLARIKEREDKARAAISGPWDVVPYVYGSPEFGYGEPGAFEIFSRAEGLGSAENRGRVVVSHQPHEGGGIYRRPDAEHITANDPAYVLADCAAKRQLIEAVVDKDPFDAMGAEGAYEQLILAHLALPFADHPDFNPDWLVRDLRD